MSDKKDILSTDTLDDLLKDIPQGSARLTDAELDRTLADILGSSAGRGASAGGGALNESAPVGDLFAQSGAAADKNDIAAGDLFAAAAAPVAPAAPKPAPETKTGGRRQARAAAQQNIPTAQQRPFKASEESALQLDNNPLLNTEDFKKFFTTTVTPGNLIPGEAEDIGPTDRHGGHSQPVEEEPEEQLPPPKGERGKRQGGMLHWVRKVLGVPEEDADPTPQTTDTSDDTAQTPDTADTPAAAQTVPPAVVDLFAGGGHTAEAAPPTPQTRPTDDAVLPTAEASQPAGPVAGADAAADTDDVRPAAQAGADADVPEDATTIFTPAAARQPDDAVFTPSQKQSDTAFMTADDRQEAAEAAAAPPAGDTAVFDAAKARENRAAAPDGDTAVFSPAGAAGRPAATAAGQGGDTAVFPPVEDKTSAAAAADGQTGDAKTADDTAAKTVTAAPDGADAAQTVVAAHTEDQTQTVAGSTGPDTDTDTDTAAAGAPVTSVFDPQLQVGTAVAAAAAQAPAAQPDDEPAEPFDDEAAEYTHPSQQQDIAAMLHATTRALTVRAAILGVLCFNAVYFALAGIASWLPQPAGLVSPEAGGVFTLGVYLVSLLIGMAVSLPVMKNGVTGLWAEPSADSFTVLSCLGALVQTVLQLVGGRQPGMAFAPLALAALLCATLGKRMLSVDIQRNFDRLTRAQQRYAVAALVADAGVARRLAHGLEEPDPYLLVSRPTGFYNGFLRQSFSVRQGDILAKRPAQALAALAVLAGVLTLAFGGEALTAFAGVLCIGCPLTTVLISAVPNRFMTRSAGAIGAMLPGAEALEQLQQVNVVVADARDIFPAGSVLLKGMKVFGAPRIDLAILYAASILVPNCTTLRDVFLKIIQDRTEILLPVENLHTELGCGYEGWVDKRRLLVGNRGMMVSHGVEVPPEAYELRYTKDGRYCPVYLAVNGRLMAMFVVGYRPNADVKEMLDEVYESGLSLLVRSDDFNLTGKRINAVYGIPQEAGCIKVLGDAETKQLSAYTSYTSAAEGAMLHAGTSFKGFIAGIRIAASARSVERAAALLQAVGALLTGVLVLVLSCTGGIAALSVPTMLLYQLAWLVLVLVLPMTRQY